ncbi:MAG: AAA family ATPase, partial [Planctomycetes bacterium]|nr:AAA family ATPase [Planctomycetota bacterium]
MPKQIPYGIANYEELIEDNCYFIDKTAYIEKLERIKNPIFLRPRKFGKSLWCRILECYYDINQTGRFEALFGETYIGQNPTLGYSLGRGVDPPLRHDCRDLLAILDASLNFAGKLK